MYDLYNSNKYLNMDPMYKKFTSQVKNTCMENWKNQYKKQTITNR